VKEALFGSDGMQRSNNQSMSDATGINPFERVLFIRLQWHGVVGSALLCTMLGVLI